MTPTRKKCSKCKRRRLVKFFSVDRRRKDGRSLDCKTCRAAYQRAYYADPKNKAKRKVYTQGYYQANKEAIKAKTDAHRRANLERYAAWQAEYRRTHPEYAKRHRDLMRKRYREERDEG